MIESLDPPGPYVNARTCWAQVVGMIAYMLCVQAAPLDLFQLLDVTSTIGAASLLAQGVNL